MAQATQPETVVPATVKLPESLWKRVKIEAIQRSCTVSLVVEEALERALTDEQAPQPKRRARGGGGRPPEGGGE